MSREFNNGEPIYEAGEYCDVDTGKVEYAPDYKSAADSMRAFGEALENMVAVVKAVEQKKAERARLEKAVVSAARAEYGENPFLQAMASRRFRNALAALESFEAAAEQRGVVR